MADFSGKWFTTFGPMQLEQNDSVITGTYQMGNHLCEIRGRIEGDRFEFRYQEPNAEGEGYFELLRSGKFSGKWKPDDALRWENWNGVRGFDGIWQTSFGPMRLVQKEDKVVGFYECTGHATIEGQLVNDQLQFRYQEPNVGGEGYFSLSDDGQSFEGKWHPDESESWRNWQGQRVRQRPGLTWLIVLEAHWQDHLQDHEYAFGNMLREFFARVPNVQFRHRYFTNAEGLEKWCRELMYLPEPVVLVIASHGTSDGLTAHGELIGSHALANGLRYADNLQLLHFSACLMMEKGEESEWFKALDQPHFPISGYTTSVDWAASAMTEFLFLDMILSKGLSPQKAADVIVDLLPFAGDVDVPGSPYRSAGFRFLSLGRRTEAAPELDPDMYV